jgi:Inhibitor of vertebrate lysozyme (Ivy)
MPARLLLVLLLLAPVAAQATDAETYLPDLMEQPAYLKAWKAMLAGETVPPWVDSFTKTQNATSAPAKSIPVGGQPYTLGWICKPHDCGDNQLYVLFTPEARQAWGLLISPGDKRQWIGRPDPAIQAAILSGVQ